MNKERILPYNQFEFMVSIKEATKVEKRPNGRRWHTVTTNDMGGSNYYKKDEIEDKELEKTVERHIEEAKQYADNFQEMTPFEARLLAMGFN